MYPRKHGVSNDTIVVCSVHYVVDLPKEGKGRLDLKNLRDVEFGGKLRKDEPLN